MYQVHQDMQTATEELKATYNASKFTVDVKTMYASIDTNHTLAMLQLFLEDLEQEGTLAPEFDINTIM